MQLMSGFWDYRRHVLYTIRLPHCNAVGSSVLYPQLRVRQDEAADLQISSRMSYGLKLGWGDLEGNI